MKKSFKLANVVAAALFAVSPIVTVNAALNGSTNVVQASKKKKKSHKRTKKTWMVFAPDKINKKYSDLFFKKANKIPYKKHRIEVIKFKKTTYVCENTKVHYTSGPDGGEDLEFNMKYAKKRKMKKGRTLDFASLGGVMQHKNKYYYIIESTKGELYTPVNSFYFTSIKSKD